MPIYKYTHQLFERSTGILYHYVLYRGGIPKGVHLLGYAHIDAMELILRNRFHGVSIEEYMLYINYQGIDRLVLKWALMWTYERMVIWTDDRDNKSILFEQGLRKYIRVTTIIIF